ncbi:MAG: hypothetical protein M1819_001778 [Sarea resinae]|nr:MAG: hypothetical protein M1819_001778 [Sarea resinae]
MLQLHFMSLRATTIVSKAMMWATLLTARAVNVMARPLAMISLSMSIKTFQVSVSSESYSAPLTTHAGLYIVPSVLPPKTQMALLSRLVHRDLSDERHNSNLHLHHHVPYPPPNNTGHVFPVVEGQDEADPYSRSFFTYPPSSPVQFMPKDPTVHRSLLISQVLSKKLRWITLGGQYDWTNKRYPAETVPLFPRDIADLMEGFFPEVRAQAAIVNFYSPGDTLSMHRDVSEECDRGLISLSLGCDAIFVVGIGEDGRWMKHLTMRLRSGDAVYMSGQARFAWHGVPKIIANTCPDWLRDWPAPSREERGPSEGDVFEPWRGWMASKRVNLNIRQMHD